MPVYNSNSISKYINSIRFWNDGKVVISSSNLTGKNWDGNLVLLPSAEDEPLPQHTLATSFLESGIASMVVYGSGELAIGLDSGCIQFLSIIPDPSDFTEMGNMTEHDDSVNSLSVTTDQYYLISGSYDFSIKIWDLNTLTSLTTYRPAHGNIVWSVATNPMDNHIFASSGEDGKVLIWDSRQQRPATLLISVKSGHLKAPVTAVAWEPIGTTLALGDKLGCVLKADPRTPGQPPLQTIDCHTRPLHFLEFSPFRPGYLATCADETIINVLDWGDMKICYRDDQHKDFVRGFCWHPKDLQLLYSCGWDCAVYSHKPFSHPFTSQ